MRVSGVSDERWASLPVGAGLTPIAASRETPRPNGTGESGPTWPTPFDDRDPAQGATATHDRWPDLPLSDLDGSVERAGTVASRGEGDRSRDARLIAEQRAL
jgi:hypothetical protein